jgi:hypothetical protein
MALARDVLAQVGLSEKFDSYPDARGRDPRLASVIRKRLLQGH